MTDGTPRFAFSPGFRRRSPGIVDRGFEGRRVFASSRLTRLELTAIADELNELDVGAGITYQQARWHAEASERETLAERNA